MLAGIILLTVSSAMAEEITLVFAHGKMLGAHRQVMQKVLRKFEQANPGIRVVERELPNATDQQHQYYLTSLGGGANDIDVFSMDVIWVSEFAEAGWLVPFELPEQERDRFLRGPLNACIYQKKLLAIPWYTDAGLLYYRRDLLQKFGIAIPKNWTWPQISAACAKILRKNSGKSGQVKYGMLIQGRHYEGLVCAFLEVFRGCGGKLFDGERVVLDNQAGKAALKKFAALIHEQGTIPTIINNLDEEKSRRAFLAGEAVFLRNWPYVWSHIEKKDSPLRGKVGVAPPPHAEGHEASATLGGWQLAVSSFSRHPKAAAKLARFVTGAYAQKQFALYLGLNPTRIALYRDQELLQQTPFFGSLYNVFIHAQPRPVTPLYPKISQILQREVSNVISASKAAEQAADNAAAEIRAVVEEQRSSHQRVRFNPQMLVLITVGLVLAALSIIIFRGNWRENIQALAYLTPALLVILFVALLPLLYALVLGFYDVKLANIIHPEQWAWQGLSNFQALLGDPHFGRALVNTLAITVISVSLELVFGLVIAMTLAQHFVGRGPMRALMLLPWIIPTVVAAKMWSWIFTTSGGLSNYLLQSLGLISQSVNWASPTPAFISIIIAEVWKTTPFMAILLIAGLTTIPKDLYLSAKIDGASWSYSFSRITLPLLQPAILLALLFRSMDALRIFDVVYVMTGYSESTKTLSIYVYEKMGTGDLSYASALSIATFIIIFLISMLYLWLLGKKLGVKK